MRTDTANFIDKNARLAKYPRWVIEIASDTAATDLTHFTSHSDAAVPSTATTVFSGTVRTPSSTSQKLNPIKANSSIGHISAEIQDPAGAVTAWIKSKLDDDEGLRRKRLRIYLGYKGLDWADYTLFQTQVIQDYSFKKGGSYLFQCEDIQREARKDIFDPKETNLTASVEIGDTTITVNDTSEFETVFHGTSYTDAPSTTVGYIKINDEIIRYTGKTATTFTGCTRGVLATREARHEVDTSVSVDRRPKVEEFIYLELPVPKLIYALLTGTLYNDSATIPSHWHLGISTAYVATSKFTNLGADLWNTTDDTQGKIGRFKGPKKQDGKKFIETQCQPLIGCFLNILNDGQLGIKRFANAIHDANPVLVLDESNIISWSELKHDLTDTHNKFVINWNKVLEKDELTRQKILLDANSITRHGTADPITYDLEGLDGARHTNSTINSMFDFLRDRYAGPPELITVTCLFTVNHVDVGDIVKVNLTQCRDATTNTTLNRSFEVQQKRIDARNGVVTLSLFGSSEKATPVAVTTDTTSLTDAFYSTDVDAGNKLDAALTTTLTGGVLHLDTNGTLTGQSDGSLQAARYWYDGDVTLDTGITITGTENIVLMIMGTLTINGTLTLKGQGKAASANGTAGYLGSTKAGGGINVKSFAPALEAFTFSSVESATAQGTNDVFPVLNIDYDGSNNFSGLTGIPSDLRGTSGGTGGTMNGINFSPDRTGGAGGASGGGLVIICRGLSMGASGVINVSGADGTAGTSTTEGGRNWFSGSGAGGAPGGLLVLLDGANAIESDVVTNLVADLGNSPLVATPVLKSSGTLNKRDVATNAQSFYSGYAAGSLKQAHSRIQYIPASETAAEDQKITADAPSAIVLVEQTNTPETPAENLASIEVTITAPSDTTYSHSNIYWKLSTESETAYEFGGVAQDEAVLITAMDGATYDVKAVPVSKLTGLESKDYVEDSITVSNQAGGVSLGSGNYIAIGQTAYDTGTGLFMENNAGSPRLSLGNSAGEKILMTGGNISITGTITATAGAIGGWTINSTTLANGTNIVLDASNKAIYINSSTFGNQGIQIEYNGGTPRMYVGDGGDKFLQYDGTDLKIGPLVELAGADDLWSNAVWHSGFAQDLTWTNETSYTDWSVVRDQRLVLKNVNTSSTETAHFSFIRSEIVHNSGQLTLNNSRDFLISTKVQGNTNEGDHYIITGDISSAKTALHFGFNFDSDGNIYATYGDGTTHSTQSLQAFSGSTTYVIRAVFDAGSSIKFYVDGTLKHTATTNLPSGVGSSYVMQFYFEKSGSGGSMQLYVGQIKFKAYGT